MVQKKHMYKNKRFFSCKMSKFLCLRFLKNGEIILAQNLWTKYLSKIKEEISLKQRNTILLEILQTLGPQVDLRKLRLGQYTAEVPFPITKNRKLFLCLKWFLGQVLQKQKNLGMERALANTFSEIMKEKSNRFQKKKLWQNQAYRSIRFIRYRWL